MPVSKNRKNHKQKVKAYKQKTLEAANRHKKFMEEQLRKLVQAQKNSGVEAPQ